MSESARDLVNTADSLRQFLRTIEKAATVLAGAANAEAVEAETRARIAALVDEEAKATKAAAGVSEDLARAQWEVQHATKLADDTITDAKAKAAEIIQVAQDAAARSKAEAAEVADAFAARSAEAEARRVSAERDRDAALADLETITQKIEAAKAAARLTFGG